MVSIWSMFVFLMMLTDRLTGFEKAITTSGAAMAIKFEEKPSCVGVDCHEIFGPG